MIKGEFTDLNHLKMIGLEQRYALYCLLDNRLDKTIEHLQALIISSQNLIESLEQEVSVTK